MDDFEDSDAEGEGGAAAMEEEGTVEPLPVLQAQQDWVFGSEQRWRRRLLLRVQ